MAKHTLVVMLLFALVSLSLATDLNGLHVDGNQIKNGDGEVVQLVGMDRQGTEYSCVQSNTIFAGPNDAASVDAMLAWGPINVVRLPINEDCWLGLHGVNASVSGVNYQDAIFDYVNLLNSKGLAVIIDLHWTSNTIDLATGQQPMPNNMSSPQVWSDIADLFKNNTMVIFDLFNEPAPDNNAWDSDAAWDCWLNGGNCAYISFETVGSQALVNMVRGRGATNLLMVGGVQYSTSIGRWLDFKPNDPLNNIAASLHSYDFNFCKSRGCFDYYLLPVLAEVPIIVGEVGETDCGTIFLQDVLPYFQEHNFHFLAFSWVAGGCSDPSLITDYSGTPSDEGVGFKTYLTDVVDGTSMESPVTFPAYTDSISHWFDDWSYGIHNVTNPSVPHTGLYSISFWPEVSGNNLHFRCWSCINSTIHRGIQFWYNGGSGPYTDMEVVLVRTDIVTSNTTVIGVPVPFSQIVDAHADEWAEGYVSLDMFEIDSDSDDTYDGFMFVTTSPKVVEVYFDDIYVEAINNGTTTGSSTTGTSTTGKSTGKSTGGTSTTGKSSGKSSGSSTGSSAFSLAPPSLAFLLALTLAVAYL